MLIEMRLFCKRSNHCVSKKQFCVIMVGRKKSNFKCKQAQLLATLRFCLSVCQFMVFVSSSEGISHTYDYAYECTEIA